MYYCQGWLVLIIPKIQGGYCIEIYAYRNQYLQATLDWDAKEINVNIKENDWIFFDDEGACFHLNMAQGHYFSFSV